MATMTCQQIVTLATQNAKVPGFTEQAGMHLNMILEDLALNYDFDLMKNEVFQIVTAGGTPALTPYDLPADYLRNATDELIYIVNGLPFTLYQKSLAMLKQFFTGPGISSYPQFFATDLSLTVADNPIAYLWPPPNGAYTITWPYQKAHEWITSPETSSEVPWFPMSAYLVQELTARLCLANDDDRGPGLSQKAEDMLLHYLKMKDDRDGYAQRIMLDRNNFPGRGRLRGTKSIPW